MARHRRVETILQADHRHRLAPDHQAGRHDHRHKLSHRCHLQQAGHLEAKLPDDNSSEESASTTGHHADCSHMHSRLGGRHLIGVLDQLRQEGGEPSHEESLTSPRQAEEEEGGVGGQTDDGRHQIFPNWQRTAACSSKLILL